MSARLLESEIARWFALHASQAARPKTSGRRDKPILETSGHEMQEIIVLVDEILAANSVDPDADTWYKEFE